MSTLVDKKKKTYYCLYGCDLYYVVHRTKCLTVSVITFYVVNVKPWIVSMDTGKIEKLFTQKVLKLEHYLLDEYDNGRYRKYSF